MNIFGEFMRSLSAFQRISVVAQRYNAVLLHNSFPARRPAEISAISVLPFLYFFHYLRLCDRGFIIIIIIITTTIMFMLLSLWPKSSREFTWFSWWMQAERQPWDQANLSELWVRRNWGSYHPDSPSLFVIITQPVSWYMCYYPKESGRLSWSTGQVLLSSLLWPFYSTVLTIS